VLLVVSSDFEHATNSIEAAAQAKISLIFPVFILSPLKISFSNLLLELNPVAETKVDTSTVALNRL
jgi:hypothetical protein